MLSKDRDLEIYLFCHKNHHVSAQMAYAGMKNLNDINAAYHRAQREIYMHIVDIAAREVINFAVLQGVKSWNVSLISYARKYNIDYSTLNNYIVDISLNLV